MYQFALVCLRMCGCQQTEDVTTVHDSILISNHTRIQQWISSPVVIQCEILRNPSIPLPLSCSFWQTIHLHNLYDVPIALICDRFHQVR